jgi:hypothetical protein
VFVYSPYPSTWGGVCVYCAVRTESFCISAFGSEVCARAKARAVGRRPLTSETPIWAQVSACEVCVGQSDNETGFPPHSPVSSVSVIPPLLHTQLDLHFDHSKRAIPRNLPATTAVFCRNLEALDGKQFLKRCEAGHPNLYCRSSFLPCGSTVQFTQILKMGFPRSS